MNLSIPTIRIGGRYRIQLRNAEGKVTKETDWFDNLVTNTGLDWYGACTADKIQQFAGYAPWGRCAVGTSNTPPTNTDTTLNAQIAVQPDYSNFAMQPSGSTTYVSGPPAYLTTTNTYTFTLGAVVGNIAEIGVGCFPSAGPTPTSATNLTLFSHALIQSGGSPTTISVTAADQLIVTFELRYYINTTDTPYSVIIAGVTYSGNMRSCVANLGSSYLLANQVDASTPTGNNTFCTVYNGTIGTITSIPSGTSSSIGQSSLPSYTAGTYTKSYTFNASTSTGNLSGGITAIGFACCLQGWQFSVSPAIPKDNTKIMSLSFSVSWARYP